MENFAKKIRKDGRDGVDFLCRDCSRVYKREWGRKRRASNRPINPVERKWCPQCKQVLPASAFHKAKGTLDGLRAWCGACEVDHCREWRHQKNLHKPLDENKACSSYLGVYIAERLLPGVFKGAIERMPYGHKGFDFLCEKRKRIDVKSGCLIAYRGHYKWGFKINQNKEADFFLLIAFNNREDLTPMHCWLLPGKLISHLITLSIHNSAKVLEKWAEYEKPLDDVLSCCQQLRDKM